jgi:hypothetical protein
MRPASYFTAIKVGITPEVIDTPVACELALTHPVHLQVPSRRGRSSSDSADRWILVL